MFRHCECDGIFCGADCAGRDCLQCDQLYTGKYAGDRRLKGGGISEPADYVRAAAAVSEYYAGDGRSRGTLFLRPVSGGERYDDLPDRDTV